MKSIIQSLKGTRDFYPEDKAVLSWIYELIRDVSQSFGYQEWDGPFLEKIDLYAAKSGEELAQEQAFVFPDRGGDLIALRPELTPTLARMVAQRQGELIFPLRWWSFGPFWRYERPQRGRTREFYQWNIDLIGTTNPESDAELIAVCAEFFRRVGLKPNQVKILVNNRRLMDTELAQLDLEEGLRGKIFRLIDRRDKMQPEEWNSYAIELGLSNLQLKELKNLLDNPDLWKHSDEMVRLFAALEALEARDYVQYEARIIRGLDYYTGTVFEAQDLDGGRAILGGGRYDNLVAAVGGNPLPGVGFAMGDVMIMLTLQKYGLIGGIKPFIPQILVTAFDDILLADAYQLANKLRKENLLVVVYPEAVKLIKQLKYADRMGIKLVLIMGPEEKVAGTVIIKDLGSRTQESVLFEDVVDVLKEKVRSMRGA